MPSADITIHENDRFAPKTADDDGRAGHVAYMPVGINEQAIAHMTDFDEIEGETGKCRKARIDQHRPVQIGRTEGCGFEIAIADIGVTEERIIESGADELGALEIGFRNIGARKVCAREIGIRHDGVIQIGIAEIELTQVDVPQIDPPFDGVFQAGFKRVKSAFEQCFVVVYGRETVVLH